MGTFSYIVCFDLDETVLEVNSAEFLIRQAYRDKIMRTSDLLHAYYLSILYRIRPKHALHIIGKMTGWLKGIPESTIAKLCTGIVNEHLLKSIRPQVYPELAGHREKNAGIVLLSSSMIPVCLPVVKHLGMDDLICSVMEVQNEQYTGKSVGRFCFGEEKLSRLNEYCTRYNYNIRDTWYYADSIWDYPVLSEVGYPICINPDKKLRRVAIEKGWRINDWS